MAPSRFQSDHLDLASAPTSMLVANHTNKDDTEFSPPKQSRAVSSKDTTAGVGGSSATSTTAAPAAHRVLEAGNGEGTNSTTMEQAANSSSSYGDGKYSIYSVIL